MLYIFSREFSKVQVPRVDCNKSILYLGFALPSHIADEVSQIDVVPHLATQKFAWSVVRALKSVYSSVLVISSSDLRNFPAARKVFFRTEMFYENGACGIAIGFINLLILKHVSRFFQVIFRVPSYIKKNSVDIILVHGSHTPYMFFAVFAKIIFRVPIVILLTDAHGKQVASDGRLGRVLRKIDTVLMKYVLGLFDAYVCLSPVFVSKFNLNPSLVVPGVLSGEHCELVARVSSARFAMPTGEYDFRIVFAGAVREENGVDWLLAAFEELKGMPISVQIYGGGELVQRVVDASSKDPRIAYGGILHGRDLVEALLSADILINPRPIEEEFARESFPSKLLEYMATGVPTLTTRIESIPSEIQNCFFYIDGHAPHELAESIKKVVALSEEERLSKGKLAAEKVIALYSEKSFGMKVVELINSLD